MNKPRDSYLRPNSNWTCGGSGNECDHCPGPVAGRCSARPRCQPIKMGELWVPTLDPKLGTCLIGPLADGQCCQGPGACSPRMSLRGYRRAFTWCCVALTVAALFCGFSPRWRGEFLAPGPLTSHHAQVLAGQGIDRCAACHQSAAQPFTQWLASTATGNHHGSTSQSQLCLKCHGDMLPQPTALAPHNLDPDTLAQYTAKLTGVSTSISNSHAESLACSVCHREHHGADHELSTMTDRQCQTCHSTNYHSFESNHLEFAATFPARRRARIAFDHVTHKTTHFAGKSREFDCRACHIGDATQNVQLLASFESTCMECHQQQIEENEGLAIFSLPLIDLDAIRKSGSTVAAWPISATGQFDGRIPPLMKVLLSADPRVRGALEQLGPRFQFSDIDSTKVEQVRLAAAIANGIKTLIDELAIDTQATLRRRMAQSLGVSSDAPPLNDWLASVPADRLQTLKANWFARVTGPDDDAFKQSSSSLWIPSESDILARYNPSPTSRTKVSDDQDLVPNPLKDKLRPPSGLANSQLPAAVKPPGEAPQPAVTGGTFRTGQASIPDDELLANNPLCDGNLNNLKKPVAAAVVAVAPIEPADTVTPNANDNESSAVELAGSVAHLQPSENSRWQIDNTTLNVEYRPVQHRDNSLKSLFDLIALSENKDGNPSVQQLFQQLSSDVGAGACGKCHTADRAATSHVVNWNASYRSATASGFTSFSHKPHLIDSSGQSCTNCHRLEVGRALTSQFHGDDPHKFASNFQPIRKSECATCHQRGMASNSCTQCHNYHVGNQISLNKK